MDAAGPISCERDHLTRRVARYTLVKRIIDGWDLQFALTRCCSRGDSNRRSSLVFSTWEEVPKSGRFRPEFVGTSLGEQFSERL
jgi:hypothetical protein